MRLQPRAARAIFEHAVARVPCHERPAGMPVAHERRAPLDHLHGGGDQQRGLILFRRDDIDVSVRVASTDPFERDRGEQRRFPVRRRHRYERRERIVDLAQDRFLKAGESERRAGAGARRHEHVLLDPPFRARGLGSLLPSVPRRQVDQPQIRFRARPRQRPDRRRRRLDRHRSPSSSSRCDAACSRPAITMPAAVPSHRPHARPPQNPPT